MLHTSVCQVLEEFATVHVLCHLSQRLWLRVSYGLHFIAAYNSVDVICQFQLYTYYIEFCRLKKVKCKSQ